MNKFKMGDKVKDKEGNLLTITRIKETLEFKEINEIRREVKSVIKYKVKENNNTYYEEDLTLYEELKTKLSNEEFLEQAKALVRAYAEAITHEEDFKVYVVWSCKTLQNSKALLSTTIGDTRYYEITYNGDKNEIYFDAYTKEVNRLIEVK